VNIPRILCLVLVLSVHLIAAATGMALGSLPDNRAIAWLVTPEGRMLMLFRGDDLVGRQWRPAERTGLPFSLGAVYEAWLVTPWSRSRGFVLDSKVTALTNWNSATGAVLTPSQHPRPPKPLSALIVWPVSTTATDTPSDLAIENRVNAIIEEELAALALEEPATSPIDAVGEMSEYRPRDESSQSVAMGFTSDRSDQPSAVTPTSSTTSNSYVEYNFDSSVFREHQERFLNSRLSIGSRIDEVSVNYSIASPSMEKDSYRLSFLGYKESQKEDATSPDSSSYSLQAQGSKVINDSLQVDGNLEASSLAYSPTSTYTFDNRTIEGALGVTFYKGLSTYGAHAMFEDMKHPDDPGSDYTQTSYELSWQLDHSPRAYDITYLHTSEDTDDGSLSLESATTAGDYEDDDIRLSMSWTISDRVSSNFHFSRVTRQWTSPNEYNFDYDITELGAYLDLDAGSKIMIALSGTLSKERYRDRDGDDGLLGAIIREDLDDVDNAQLRLDLSTARGLVDLAIGTTWGRTHYPASSQTLFDLYVDGQSLGFDISVAWRFAKDWSLDLAADNNRETYDARHFDDTESDSYSATVRRTF